MQLGTRWAIGAEPPSRLDSSVTAAIASVESELSGVDTTQWRWTLTWLEGRPVIDLDDGTSIRVGHDGDVVVTNDNTPL